MLCQLRHPNILAFFGATGPPDPSVIVTEYMRGGSLHDVRTPVS